MNSFSSSSQLASGDTTQFRSGSIKPSRSSDVFIEFLFFNNKHAYTYMLKTHKCTPIHHPKPSKIHGKTRLSPHGTLPFIDSFINKNIAQETFLGHLPNSNLCYRYWCSPTKCASRSFLPFNARVWLALCAFSLPCKPPGAGGLGLAPLCRFLTPRPVPKASNARCSLKIRV